MDSPDELELLYLARRQGLLSQSQAEVLLRAWDEPAGKGAVCGFADFTLGRGWLSAERIREIAKLRTGARDVELGCVSCGRTSRLPLLTALRHPQCPACSGPLAPSASSASTPPPAEPAPPLPLPSDPDRRLGKYVLLERIGVGGMGEVWSAWDTAVQRAVALKFPKSIGEEEIRRLYLEARGGGRLTHPGIASVFEVSEGPGRPFIAMQFIEGRPAHEEAALDRDPRNHARWIRDAARAVHFAHEHGVIHRDLKPSNLMVDGQGRVFVMDFGLAKVQASAMDSSVSGAILGTPAYMSPEQAGGRSTQIDVRSDVYSLGATLYSLLCGRRPYEGESPTDVLLKVLSSDAPPLRSHRPDVPSALEAVVQKAMRREKERRYPTAAAMADDLDRFLSGRPVSAPSTGMTARWTAQARRPVPVWKAGLAVLAALALGGVAWWARPSAPPAPPDRLAAWTALYGRLRQAADPDTFDPAAAAELLGRVRAEFPEQGEDVAGLLDQQHRLVEAALAAIPRERWRASRPQVERYRAWLSFAGKPTAPADRVLAARPTCTIAVDVHPPALLRGPLVEGVPSGERVTPLARRELEIAPGPLELVLPGRAPVRVALPALEEGGDYVLEGRADDPPSLRWRSLSRPP